MAIRKIVRFGDSVLEKECRKVEKFDKKLHQLLDDMKETLADADGAGLAAPPGGHPARRVRGGCGRGPHRAGKP